MLDSNKQVTYTLLRAASMPRICLCQQVSTRRRSEDIAVRGGHNDINFKAGEDQVTYRINVPNKTRSVTVTAELLYQPVSHSFAEDLRPDGNDLVNRFFSMFDPAIKTQTPRVVARIQKKF
jgi:hypothetical protein